MNNKLFENNKVSLIGTIASEFEFIHEIYGEKFYIVYVESERLSGTLDVIPVTISERLINVKENCIGRVISIIGQYRSYNKYYENKSHLILSVFVKEIEFLDALVIGSESNLIRLVGNICKEATCRKTPFGREIADFIISVNRQYGKTDYIPCICWGRDAVFMNKLQAGNKVSIVGRIQSREYVKRIDEETEKRIAYEVSVSTIKLSEGNNEEENN